jgi:hypothetical protein
MIIEINDADNLLRTPNTIKIPGINSANAIRIAISAGSHMFGKFFANPGSSFEIP